MKKKILIFSGAGLDKESGIETFRDSKDGLWNNHNVKEVASIDGWYRNKESVLNFYNERRRQLNEVEPNNAHLIISSLERYLTSNEVSSKFLLCIDSRGGLPGPI